MKVRNSSLVFLITLAAAATCAAAPPLVVGAKYSARDLEFQQLIIQQQTFASQSKFLASKVETAALNSEASLVKNSWVNKETGAAAAEINELPFASQRSATHYDMEMPIPRLQHQNAQNPSAILAQTKKLEVRVASDLQNRSRRLIVEERTVEIPGGGKYMIEQQQSVDLKSGEFHFVSSNISNGPFSRSVALQENGSLRVFTPGKKGDFVFNPSAQEKISDFLSLNPSAKLESGYVTPEGPSLILVYRTSQGQRWEFSYGLPNGLPSQMLAKYQSFTKQNAANPWIQVRQIAGRQTQGVKGLGVTTQEFLATRPAGGSR